MKITEEEYNKNPKYCKYCGKKIDYKRREAQFCNSSCAASYNNRKRGKLTKTLKERKLKNKENRLTKCIVCGKEFYNLPGGNNKTCSYKCLCKLRKINGSKIIKKENGTFKGWQSRNITSYPEKFFINVLNNNNIQYIREFLVHINNTKYFLDFKIEINNRIIDLEIDGKQHKYLDRINHDKIRDKNLSDLGYEIYRIPWNEINSVSGKNKMKEKIDNLLFILK